MRRATAPPVAHPAQLHIMEGATHHIMYVSLVALHLGAALFVNGWWPVVLLPVVVVLVDRLVIVREERYLEAAFGGE